MLVSETEAHLDSRLAVVLEDVVTGHKNESTVRLLGYTVMIAHSVAKGTRFSKGVSASEDAHEAAILAFHSDSSFFTQDARARLEDMLN
eukprot:3164263-Prorocentrum_lima.AAC.1